MRTRPKPAHKPAGPAALPEDIQGLVDRKDSGAAAELAQIADSADKERAKAAKRGLFLLRHSGIEPPTHTPETRSPKPEIRLAARALMTNDGGTGARMLWFIREDPHGGSPTVMLVLVDDSEGVKDLSQRKLSRRELDEQMHKINSDPTTVIAEIPLDYGRYVLQQAVRLSEDKRAALPQGFGEAYKYIGPPDTDWPRSPIYDHLDAESIRKDESIPRAPERLFEIPVFEGWLLPFEEVEPWEEKYFEAVSSRVLIDEAQRARRGDGIVDEAADELINSERIRQYRRRLEDTALVLHLAGKEAESKQALYHALTCDESAKPRSIPFLRTLAHRSIYLVIAYKAQLEEQAERANPPGSIHRA